MRERSGAFATRVVSKRLEEKQPFDLTRKAITAIRERTSKLLRSALGRMALPLSVKWLPVQLL